MAEFTPQLFNIHKVRLTKVFLQISRMLKPNAGNMYINKLFRMLILTGYFISD